MNNSNFAQAVQEAADAIKSGATPGLTIYHVSNAYGVDKHELAAECGLHGGNKVAAKKTKGKKSDIERGDNVTVTGVIDRILFQKDGFTIGSLSFSVTS